MFPIWWFILTTISLYICIVDDEKNVTRANFTILTYTEVTVCVPLLAYQNCPLWIFFDIRHIWTVTNTWANWQYYIMLIGYWFQSRKAVHYSPLRAGLHHGPWSRTMEDGPCPWSDFMIQLPWSNFFKIIYKAFGSFTRCKWNMDQEEWPCTKKWMCWFFFKLMFKKGSFEKKKSSLTILLSSFVFIFSFPK